VIYYAGVTDRQQGQALRPLLAEFAKQTGQKEAEVAAFLIGCAAIAVCIGARQAGFRW
jgi:hypothetical protein